MAKRNSDKRPTRPVKDTILILCGGETEKYYFENFKSRVAKIKVEPVLDADSPLNLVNHAIEKKVENYLQIWVVFDKDEFHSFDSAIQLADMEGINVAFSNQAFDLWYILHFKRCEGGFHRKDYGYEINKLMNRNERNKLEKPFRDIFDLLKSRMDIAITNATYGHQKHIRDNSDLPISSWESCTTVYKLVEVLKRIK